MAKVFDELESQQVAVEPEPALHVFGVDHGVVEGEFSISLGTGRRFCRRSFCRRALCGCLPGRGLVLCALHLKPLPCTWMQPLYGERAIGLKRSRNPAAVSFG